jgi:hypothetical protein
MAIDKAVSALKHGELRLAGAELLDFAKETVEKGLNPPKTRSWAVRGAQVVDLVAHGAAIACRVSGVGALAADGATLVWGLAKYAWGKGGEKTAGKGGIESDIKAAGRKSMTFATLALVSGVAYALPETAPVATAVGALAHGVAAGLSAAHLVKTFRNPAA